MLCKNLCLCVNCDMNEIRHLARSSSAIDETVVTMHKSAQVMYTMHMALQALLLVVRGRRVRAIRLEPLLERRQSGLSCLVRIASLIRLFPTSEPVCDPSQCAAVQGLQGWQHYVEHRWEVACCLSHQPDQMTSQPNARVLIDGVLLRRQLFRFDGLPSFPPMEFFPCHVL